MSDLSMQLPERLSRLGETGLLIPLLRLLADGDPVTVQQLSVAAGRTIDEVRLGLAAMQDTEYDDQGRIVGQGLTLRPTPHRFTVDGEELYTWCALDTLFFPALIGKAATIESTSPGSGTLIRVMTGADGTVTSVQPATAVVSIISHPGTGPVRSSFCNQVHYFASREDAQPWLDSHPDGEVLDIEAAHRAGAAMASALLAAAATRAPAAQDSCC